MNDKVLKFKGKIIRKVYANEDYRVYGVEIDKASYPELKLNRYGNITIVGDIGDLTFNVDYNITAKEENTKNGISYRVLNITRKKPTTIEDSFTFLSEVITEKQAKTLLDVYPNIIQKVINNDLDDIDFNKTNGIKEKTFEKIKNKIIDNICLAELVTEFKGYLSLSIIRKIYNKYPSVQSLKSKLKSNPYKCLCGLGGVGFKTADSILLEIEKVSNNNINNGKDPIIVFDKSLIESEERCLACVLYLLEENESNGHTKMNLADLRKEVLKTTPECLDKFVHCIKDDSIYYDKKTMDVALAKTYNLEKYIAKQIKYGLSVNRKWDIDYTKYTESGGNKLTDEQESVLKYLCDNNVIILNGSAGSGKSATTSSIINMLSDNNKTVTIFAPTGRASKISKSYTGLNAKTIHRGLGFMPPNSWTYNLNNKLNYDVIIIDEFSMCGLDLFGRLIDAIDFNKTKLLLVGDAAQLPSVSAGNLMRDFINSKKIPMVTLTKIFRYNSSGIINVATDIRMGKQYLPKTKDNMININGNKDYTFIKSSNENTLKSVVALYKKLLNNGCKVEDIQVLSSYNKGDYGTVNINNKLQRIANKNYGSKNNIKVGETTYYVDDIIIQKSNNYKAIVNNDAFSDDITTFISNGECGKIIDINNDVAVIDFDGTEILYTKSDLINVRLGYSISIHSSQGGSIKIPILVTPKSHTFMLNSNLLYVGITRATQQVYHIGDIFTVNNACLKREDFNRNTFMEDFLKSS